MKAKTYKFNNPMSGSKFEIRNECPRCFDLYIKLASSNIFRFVDSFPTLEAAKLAINY